MDFLWLKRFMPRGLYGRAALILILPIVTIQLVVSITFIQRHFEGVTRQMTRNVLLEVNFIADRIAAAPTLAAAQAEAQTLARGLALGITLPDPGPPITGDRRVFYDLSGGVVIASLRSTLDAVISVDLMDSRSVRLTLASPHGPMQITIDRHRVSASNPHQLLVLMLATGILMTLIAVLFLRNQLRPIRQLARVAEAFGKGRALPYRPSGALEVRAAGNAFLDMRGRIDRQIEQRTLLLSGVSHDLRTPLTRLKLGLSMLEGDTEIAEMRRDLDEMQRLLDAFLAFVRDDAVEEEPQLVDPLPLLQAIVDDGIRAGQKVRMASVSGSGKAALRPASIRRAVENLLSNAARYGGQAEVSLELLERALRITVEDDGPGIPKERQEEALQPFTRLDAARNQDRGSGVGLGLAITADIARGHGGTLRLGKSEKLGGLKATLVLAR